MFSPALVSMMFHSLPPAEPPRPASSERGWRSTFPSSWAVAKEIADRAKRFNRDDLPSLPIVGRGTIRTDFEYEIGPYLTIDATGGTTFFWGRVPLDRLVGHWLEFHAASPEEHYIDLGTPLRAGGSGSSFDKSCDRYMKLSQPDPSRAKVGVAIIDLGEDATQAPEDYGGRLHHAVSSQIKMSEHAEKVLSVLLERLDRNGVLSDTTVSCALVRPPAAMVSAGKTCFEQANAVEMLDAAKALKSQLDSDGLPAAVNISLGTHVGPHNGDSPLEEYISTALVKSRERFVVVSAGNDGGKGLAAKRELTAGEREFLTLQTGPRCKDLLVEFWWDGTNGAQVTIDADIYEPLAPAGRTLHGTVKIDPNTSGTALHKYPAGLPSNMISQSLFQANCRKNLSCIAFAIGTPGQSLPVLEVDFGLESQADTTVNAWVVVCEDRPQTTLIEGGPEGSIRVPASDTAVLSVAGVESSGQLWENSSRGPAARFRSAPTAAGAPLMAHLVTLGGEAGTSFSSPRACGDAAAALADSVKRQRCADATDLLCEAYGLQRGTLPTWNNRSGYHKVTA